MEKNEKIRLAEGVLDGLDHCVGLTNRTAAISIFAAIEAIEAEEKDHGDDEDEEDPDDPLEIVADERDEERLKNARLSERVRMLEEIEVTKDGIIKRLQVELADAKDRSKGHLTEARDQAVAELAKVQAELDDLRQNGGRDRIDKLVKARMADERREIAELEARCMEDAKRLVSERDDLSKHCEDLGLRLAKEMKRSDETMQALVARSKERDDARWECAQLHKELALYRPKPEQTEEAKP